MLTLTVSVSVWAEQCHDAENHFAAAITSVERLLCGRPQVFPLCHSKQCVCAYCLQACMQVYECEKNYVAFMEVCTSETKIENRSIAHFSF